MKPVNGKILVRCNLKQKDQMTVNGVSVKMAPQFDPNYRERSPVVCEVVQGNPDIPSGSIILVHHNTLYLPSPFHIGGDLFSIPFKGTIILAVVGPKGDLTPVKGNIICERVMQETSLLLPPELQKPHVDRSKVKDGRGTHYKPGQTIFHRPYAGYEMVYIWQNIEKRAVKVFEDQVCGILN